jgi:hypothetical protein
MENSHTMHIDDMPIRFTPDGRVAVIDAIKAVANTNRPRVIWETLQRNHPEVLSFCEDYPFQEDDYGPVVNSMGWEVIMPLLFYYITNEEDTETRYAAANG